MPPKDKNQPLVLPPPESPDGFVPPQSLVASRTQFKLASSQIDRENEEIARRKEAEKEKQKKIEEEKELKRFEEEKKKEEERKLQEELDRLPKAKIVIAADSDAIFDWQLRKMVVSVPMHQPCRPYLEQTICQKMKWGEMIGYNFYKALGTSYDNVEHTDEPLQTNLTPRQLRFTQTGINFVIVRKSKRNESEALVSANEYFRYKVEKFLELYDPNRLQQAGALMKDNLGDEQNLIDALLNRYGPEPTEKQISDKRAFLKKQRELAEAAQERARQAGLTNSIRTLSEREKENVLRILEKTAFARTQMDYYRKWRRFVIRRRLNRMIVELSINHLEKVRMKEYYGKLRMFYESRKNKRQLTASSQIAIKNEQLLGDLASENMGLKNEIRRLSAHIEVLENASSKRLDTLYSGSEAAVAELKRLTSELRYKAGYVSSLTVKEEQAKEKLARAEAERDEALILSESKLRDIEAMENDYRFQTRLVEGSNSAVLDKIGSLQRSIAGIGECKHCPHYTELRAQTAKNASSLDTLRSRIENAEVHKRGFNAQIEKIRDELTQTTGMTAKQVQRMKQKQIQVQEAHDNRVPQIFLDIEEAIRREREEEEAAELAREGMFSARAEELEKKRREKAEEEERKRRREQLNREALDENDDDQQPQQQQQNELSGGSESLLGPVGKADLSMAKYFETEITRSRNRFASSFQKQWTTKVITPYATSLEDVRKVEAAEAARLNQYHITRRQANTANALLLAESANSNMFANMATTSRQNIANANNTNNPNEGDGTIKKKYQF